MTHPVVSGFMGSRSADRPGAGTSAPPPRDTPQPARKRAGTRLGASNTPAPREPHSPGSTRMGKEERDRLTYALLNAALGARLAMDLGDRSLARRAARDCLTAAHTLLGDVRPSDSVSDGVEGSREGVTRNLRKGEAW